MTESEDLKGKAEMFKKVQQWEELTKYVDGLVALNDINMRKSLQSGLVVVVFGIIWIASTFVDNLFVSIAGTVLYFGSLGYSMWTDRVFSKSMGQLEGAIRVLKILGLTDMDWDDMGRTRRRRVWGDMADTVKGWFTRKQKVQEEAYKPA